MRQDLALDGRRSGVVLRQLWLPFACYLPASGVLLAAGVAAGLGPSRASLATLAGFLSWSLGEYLIHRFWLHSRGRRILRLAQRHLLHHKSPVDHPGTIRPWLSACVGAGLWSLSAATLGPATGCALVAGVLVGYLCYEFVHLAAHRGPQPLTPWGRYLRAHHLAHHTRSARANYAIVCPLWDVLFGTRLASPPQPRG